MAIKKIDDIYLSNISDAIRAKKGTTETYKPSEMAPAIRSIVGISKLPQMIDGTLTEITAEDLGGITKIKSYAFYESNVEIIELPNSLKKIDSYAFYTAKNLKSIKIPNTVTIIDGSSIRSCSALESIAIPYSVQELKSSCFGSCSKLTKVEFEGDSNLQKIGDMVFYQCVKLESITIPRLVAEIKANAFSKCTALVTVTVKATIPPTLTGDIFPNCTALEQIIVPIGCGDAYKGATNWSAYADIIVEEDV